MTPHVAVVGSVNRDQAISVDFFPRPGATQTAHGFVSSTGGKGFNQAAAAALTGARVSLVAMTGRDIEAKQARLDLVKRGISAQLTSTTDRAPTGRAIILVLPNGENSIAVVPGANHHLEPREVRRALQAAGDINVIAAQGELRLETLHATADTAAKLGSRLVFNPSPPLLEHLEVLPYCDTVIVNETEAEHLTGERAHDEYGVLRALEKLNRIARAVVITRGSRGSVIAMEQNAPHHIPAYPIANVVDTTGAGDAYAGTIAGRLSLGDDLLTAAHAASLTAALATTKRGAAASYPSHSELHNALREHRPGETHSPIDGSTSNSPPTPARRTP